VKILKDIFLEAMCTVITSFRIATNEEVAATGNNWMNPELMGNSWI